MCTVCVCVLLYFFHFTCILRAPIFFRCERFLLFGFYACNLPFDIVVNPKILFRILYLFFFSSSSSILFRFVSFRFDPSRSANWYRWRWPWWFWCFGWCYRQVLKTHEPVYQAIWVDNIDFDEVLISPAMIQDHMPDTVLAALEKVSRKLFKFTRMQCYTLSCERECVSV